jgi:hypothetical protein
LPNSAGTFLTRSARLPLARDCLPQQKTAEGSALINVARNLGGSFGVSLANTELLQRSQFHQARLAENIVPSSPTYQSIVKQITEFFAHTGSPVNAAGRAKGYIGHLIDAGGNPRLYRHLLQLDDLYCLSHSFSAAAGPASAARAGRSDSDALKQRRAGKSVSTSITRDRRRPLPSQVRAKKRHNAWHILAGRALGSRRHRAWQRMPAKRHGRGVELDK